MSREQSRSRIRKLAYNKCKKKHPDYYDSIICVGPGSGRGFGPPCDECINEVERAQKRKQKFIKK